MIEDIADVTEGRILVAVWLESSSLGHNLVRPDTALRYLPLAQIIQVGSGVDESYVAGEWYYVSQYAGQIISLEGIDKPSREARLVCTSTDILLRFPGGEEVAREILAA